MDSFATAFRQPLRSETLVTSNVCTPNLDRGFFYRLYALLAISQPRLFSLIPRIGSFFLLLWVRAVYARFLRHRILYHIVFSFYFIFGLRWRLSIYYSSSFHVALFLLFTIVLFVTDSCTTELTVSRVLRKVIGREGVCVCVCV